MTTYRIPHGGVQCRCRQEPHLWLVLVPNNQSPAVLDHHPGHGVLYSSQSTLESQGFQFPELTDDLEVGNGEAATDGKMSDFDRNVATEDCSGSRAEEYCQRLSVDKEEGVVGGVVVDGKIVELLFE